MAPGMTAEFVYTASEVPSLSSKGPRPLDEPRHYPSAGLAKRRNPVRHEARFESRDS